MLDWDHIGKYRENNRLEAKKAQGGLPHSIWETYSAFANTHGGLILLGVIENEDKSFSSVPLADPEQLVEEFWSVLNRPGVVSANILENEDVCVVESGGNRIVVIENPRAGKKDRQVYIGTDPYSGSYQRSGEGDYRIPADQVLEMLEEQEKEKNALLGV